MPHVCDCVCDITESDRSGIEMRVLSEALGGAGEGLCWQVDRMMAGMMDADAVRLW